MIYKFKAPTFEEIAKRYLAIPFAGVQAANTQGTLVVGPIPFRYRVIGAEMIFRVDANDAVRYYWLASTNKNPSTTGIPAGRNLFGYLAPVGYFVGDGITRKIPCGVTPPVRYKYVKLHTWNGNPYATTVNATLEIEEV